MSAVRVYRACVRLYPRAFREEFGDDLVALFADQRRDESSARVIVRTAIDLVVTVPIRHLEVPMRDRAPSTMVLIYSLIALGGIATAAIGGSDEVAVSLGLLVAAVAGALAVVTRRHSEPADAGGRWWKVTATGVSLIAAVIVGAGLGIEAWYLAWLAAIVGIAMVAVGLLLGAFRLFQRLRPTAVS